MIVPEINRDPWNERDPKKHIHVCPQHRRVDAANEVNEIVMIDPVDRDNDEAEDIGKKVGHIFANEAGVGSCGAFNSRTIIVMRMAMTPSLNASIRFVFIPWKCSSSRPRCVNFVSDLRLTSAW